MGQWTFLLLMLTLVVSLSACSGPGQPIDQTQGPQADSAEAENPQEEEHEQPMTESTGPSDEYSQGSGRTGSTSSTLDTGSGTDAGTTEAE